MTVKFDDSLPILVHTVVDELGAAALSTGVILRDVVGKLAYFSRSKIDRAATKRLSNRLRKELGP